MKALRGLSFPSPCLSDLAWCGGLVIAGLGMSLVPAHAVGCEPFIALDTVVLGRVNISHIHCGVHSYTVTFSVEDNPILSRNAGSAPGFTFQSSNWSSSVDGTPLSGTDPGLKTYVNDQAPHMTLLRAPTMNPNGMTFATLLANQDSAITTAANPGPGQLNVITDRGFIGGPGGDANESLRRKSYSSVPVGSTWVMMLTGIALVAVGASMRRKTLRDI